MNMPRYRSFNMPNFVVTIARLMLGSIFFVYGLDGFFHFMSNTLAPGRATEFISAMMNSGYLWTMLKIGETIGGAMLIADLFVPLALVLLAPIVVNILCFHWFLNPGGQTVGIYPIGVAIALLELLLAWFYREYFQSLFVFKAAPSPTVLRSLSSDSLASSKLTTD